MPDKRTPAELLAQRIHEATDGGRELVAGLLEDIANPNLSSAARHQARARLEQLRRRGIAID